MAAVNRYAVGIQLISMAFAANSLAIAGRAILIEEPMKGVKKEAIQATNKADILLTFILLLTQITHLINYLKYS
jgi:hypothetical protein